MSNYCRIMATLLLIVIALVVLYAGAAVAESLIDIDGFVSKANKAFKELEMDTVIKKKDLPIESGPVNDTVTYFLSKEAFLILTLDQGTEDIKEIWFRSPYRGDGKQPEMLLEGMCLLTYASGVTEELNEVNQIMYDIGMYGQKSFAIGTESSIPYGDSVKFGYSVSNEMGLFAYCSLNAE